MKSRVSLIVALLFTVFAFQNCGKGGFDAADGLSEKVSLSSTDTPAPTNLNCTFDGNTISNGASVSAFLVSTHPTACVSQTRVCNRGTLSGSYQYSSCAVGQAASCLFNGITVPSGTSFPAYQTASVAAGQNCVEETRVCNGGILSGSYANASCVVAKPAISGTWVQACRTAATGSGQQTQFISGSTFQSTLKIYPTDAACGSLYATATLTGSVALGDQVSGTNVNKLNLSNIRASVTINSSIAVFVLNLQNVCGYIGGWQVGVPRDVTGVNCTIEGYNLNLPSGNLYTSVRVQNGNQMYLGYPDSATQNGTSEAMRALTPDPVPLMKQ